MSERDLTSQYDCEDPQAIAKLQEMADKEHRQITSARPNG